MIKITEIAYTAYPVTDLARARAFYEGTLGLVETLKFGEGDKGWIEYDLGGATLAITNMSADMWKPSSDGPAVALEVEDFNAAVAALRAAQVRFVLEPMKGEPCSLAVINDPDGNGIAIHKRNAH